MAQSGTKHIRERNILDLVGSLRRHGPVARVDLGPLNGISSATITSISAELLPAGIIEERASQPVRSSVRGRPKTLIALNARAAFVICAKLSINELHLVVGDFSGALRGSVIHALDTRTLTFNALCNCLGERIEGLAASVANRFGRFAGVCIAVQGTVAVSSGTIAWSPALRLRDAPVGEHLARRFDCPVFLDNDTNCIARAIAATTDYGYDTNLAVIMLGYGVGMSVSIDGRPYLGCQGSAAEFGHSKYRPDGPSCACGRRGCIEAYVSDYALYRDGRSLLDLPSRDTAHPSEYEMQALTDIAKAGNATARILFENAGHVLGFGLANVLAFFNPNTVLITGAGVRAYTLMEPAMTRSLHQAMVKELIGHTRIASHPWDQDLTLIGGVVTALANTDVATVLGGTDA